MAMTVKRTLQSEVFFSSRSGMKAQEQSVFVFMYACYTMMHIGDCSEGTSHFRRNKKQSLKGE